MAQGRVVGELEGAGDLRRMDYATMRLFPRGAAAQISAPWTERNHSVSALAVVFHRNRLMSSYLIVAAC